MKKSLLFFLSMALLFACNQSSNKTKSENHAAEEHAIADTQLTLNNGNKWKADTITNNNVADIKMLADNFKIKPFPSIADYQLAGSDLNNSVNKMIRECRMSGPDHDALHKWLEPLLVGTNQLKNATDTSVARTTFTSIDNRINEYYNFFE